LSIVVTTTVWGDVVENVVDDDGTVEILFPAGVDPHEYQASSQQVASLNQADLVVANGLGLEAGLVSVLEAAESDGVNVFEVAPLLDPLPVGGSEASVECDPDQAHDDGAEVDHVGGCDPHVWMDPGRVADASRLLAAELTAIDATVDWQARADDYAAKLLAADEKIAALLGTVPVENRKLVTNHDTLGYLANRYGYEVIGTVVPGGSTLSDPSSEDLARLVEVIRQEGVSVVFAETIEPAALAEAVAAEVGDIVQVIELHTDSLGEAGSGADSLIGLLMTNAESITAALS
jgi:zinc/manganese transport system substrate-binding protein